MSDQSTRLGLPYLAAAQAQKHVTVNDALRRLDAVVQLAAVSATTAAQPAAPSDGSVYILPAGKTGAAWGPMANGALAYYRDGAWEQITPREGWLAWVMDADALRVFDGAAWVAAASGAGGGLTAEEVRDTIGATLVAGANVTITVNDASDTITIAAASGGGGAIADNSLALAKLVNAAAQHRIIARSAAGAGPWQELASSADAFALLGATDFAAMRAALGLGSAALAASGDFASAGHAHSASQIADFAEAVDDRVAALLTAGANVTLGYDDAAGRLTISAASGGGGGGGSSALPPGFLFGLTLANNATDATNDIDIAAGRCRDGADTADMILAGALTKRLDAAWAAGSGNGGLDAGSIANSTYHVHLIRNPTSGVVDALFSTSPTAPTLPSGFTQFRRIGSIIRASNAIRAFGQNGDVFQWRTPVTDVNTSSTVTTAVTATVTAPAGIVTRARGTATLFLSSASSNSLFVSALADTDILPGFFTGAQAIVRGSDFGGAASGFWEVVTNTSAQVRYRLADAGGTTVAIVTHGYIDTRGRLA